MKTVCVLLLLVLSACGCLFAQSADFVPGWNVIFEDNFSQDPVGDFPAKWSTNSEGTVEELDGFSGKWLRLNGSVAVSPELTKKLPEDCTIEFDVVMKKGAGRVVFGVTSLSDVAVGNVYQKRMSVTLQTMPGYAGIVVNKDMADIYSKRDFDVSGYIERTMHVSISINKTRFRVYIDETKVVDMPKLLTPDYRSNFFVAGGRGIPVPTEGVYFSNLRIAAGEADARRLLIKQLFDQGSVVTSDIGFNSQTNEMTQQSYYLLDTLGQALAADPNLNIQINGMDDYSTASGTTGGKELVMQKVEQMKNYLVNKFNLKADRIATGVTDKLKLKTDAVKQTKAGQKLKGFITEFVKL